MSCRDHWDLLCFCFWLFFFVPFFACYFVVFGVFVYHVTFFFHGLIISSLCALLDSCAFVCLSCLSVLECFVVGGLCLSKDVCFFCQLFSAKEYFQRGPHDDCCSALFIKLLLVLFATFPDSAKIVMDVYY